MSHWKTLLAASAALSSAGAKDLSTPISLPGTQALGAPMQIIVLLTLLTLVPAIIMSITPFMRISIVLHILRQALGTQSTPTNQVLVGLALFLSLLIIQPVFRQVYETAWQPLERGQITSEQALHEAEQPLRTFMLRFAREKDIQLFLQVTHTAAPARPDQLDMTVLVPAYIISELKAGFQIGAVLFIPFLVIDLVVASVTVSVGMMQLPPVMISAPFKVLVFVLVDGWNLVIGSLVRSFYQ
jgi:flagellar biosynthesis protein FliP